MSGDDALERAMAGLDCAMSPTNSKVSPVVGELPAVLLSELMAIADALRLMHGPGEVFEVRLLGSDRGTVAGYFDSADEAAEAIMPWDGRVEGVYHTLNPCDPALLSRSKNRLREYIKKGALTTDKDIRRRRWLPIDIDPERPSGISATDGEVRAAGRVARRIKAHLEGECSWPAGVLAMSGNGGHLYYRVDLPNDDESRALLKRLLKKLADEYDEVGVAGVDTSVHNAARLMKVPETLACKGDPTEERPHRRSHIVERPEELAVVPLAALQSVAGSPPAKDATKHSSGPNGYQVFDLEVWMRRAGLAVRSHKTEAGAELWELEVCPFNPEHDRGEAFISRAADGALLAGCHHNSCTWHWHDLRERFEPGYRERQREAEKRTEKAAVAVGAYYSPKPPPPEMKVAESVGGYAPAGRRKIVITNRPLRDVSDDAIAALRDVNDPPTLFSQSPFIVRLRQDAGQRLRIEQVGDDALRYHLTGAADFMTTPKNGDAKHANPPHDVLRNINATPDPPFPPLETLRTSPVLRPDYSIVTQTGYDTESRVFYAPPPGFVLPPLPPLREAVRWLDEALGAFCYADDGASRANAYALLLTPLLRLVLRGNVPLAVIDSPQQGCGKTCLVNVISLITTGGAASTVSEPEDDAEWRKMLTSALRRGDELLTIDNVTRMLKSARLAEFITTEWWTDRLLGGNEMPSLAQRMSVTVTGNNVALGGDLGRRCYLITLDAKCARPWIDRHYPHPDLQAWVIANRGALLASVLTLVDSWVKDGTPPAPGTPWLGNFGDWCQVIGAILTHAGVAGFLGNLESVYSALDVEAEQWEAFLVALREQYGDQPFTSAQLALELGADGHLHDAAPDALEWVLKGGPEGLTIRLGKALRAQVGRRYGAPTMRITSHKDSHTRKTVWVVEADQAQLCV